MKKYFAPLLVVLLVCSVIGNGIAYERFSSQRPLITVNSDVIRRKDLDDRVNYMYRDQVLRKLIWNRLIMQEARRDNCVPTDAQVNQTITQIERTTPAVIDQARQTDPSLSIFRQDLAETMAVRNLRIVGITVTDAESRDYYAAHKQDFALPVQSHTTTVIAKDSLSAETAKQLLLNGTEPAVIAGREGMSVVGIDAQLKGTIPPSINTAVLSMQDGQVSVFPVESEFMVVKITKRSPAVIPSYESIKDQIELAARVQKAPSSEQILNGLVARANIHADSDIYKNAIPVATQDTVASADN